MVGQQQTFLALLAHFEFGLSGYTFLLAYVAAFGIAKATSNWFAGTLSDRYGRKPVLLADGFSPFRCRSCSSLRRIGAGPSPQTCYWASTGG